MNSLNQRLDADYKNPFLMGNSNNQKNETDKAPKLEDDEFEDGELRENGFHN